MACNILDFKLSGISIEVLDANLLVNVRDAFGEIVEDASVSINCNGNIEQGYTDDEGFFYAIVLPETICTISITKGCLDPYSGKFILRSEQDINDANANFPVMVLNASDAPISGATVSISPGISGTTDSNGFYKGINSDDYNTTITISKSGYQTYTATIPDFIKITGELTGYHIVPVINLQTV